MLHLTLEDREIKFEPELKLYLEVLLHVYELLLSSISMVPCVETKLYLEWVKSESVCVKYAKQKFCIKSCLHIGCNSLV